VKYAKLSEIEVPPNRQRREFGEKEIQELGNSIESIGLLHPLVVRREGEKLFLVAGERRLRAIQDIYELSGSFDFNEERVPAGLVPYVLMGELSPLEAMEAEFEENVRRVDLNWQDRARATTDLMNLRAEQARAKGNDAPTIKDLALELADTKEENVVTGLENAVAQDLKVARSLHDPDVAAAKSRKEALKVIKKKEEAKRNVLLAEAVGKTFSMDSHYHLVQGDSWSIAQKTAAESYDVILTDPPYGMGADEFGDSGGKAAGEHFYGDSPEVLEKILDWFPKESYRLAKPEAHLYVFCDYTWSSVWQANLALAGWEVFRTPLIWNKPNAYRAPWPDGGPQRRYELIIYARKGKMKVQKMLGDVLTHAPDENLGHQAQKPVSLYADLLSRSVVPGMTIWDPFCGTGPIFPAAHQFKCIVHASEQDKAAYGIAAGRIKELK